MPDLCMCVCECANVYVLIGVCENMCIDRSHNENLLIFTRGALDTRYRKQLRNKRMLALRSLQHVPLPCTHAHTHTRKHILRKKQQSFVSVILYRGLWYYWLPPAHVLNIHTWQVWAQANDRIFLTTLLERCTVLFTVAWKHTHTHTLCRCVQH